ncbi:WbuC family cupin fold metalloprotein [Andreprevotia chitinilytica]|uniref:WbuC family cupin fold metalloprotein n=1 Tax=Andreprevotia chitinilytica TaxID=396808 RepID=UPI000550C79F|nr:WbuC family cupin fold metalloprotein [Andreprevotia chitinilytica]
MSAPRLIDQNLLAELSREAAQSPRLRKNRNFHADNADACHRLLNALEPGTYVQPHRHLNPLKEETIIVLAGRVGVLFFDEAGQIDETCVIAAGGAVVGVNVPVGCFHSLVALEPGSVFFESKTGPYEALTDAEKATWAPAENQPETASYLDWMVSRFL